MKPLTVVLLAAALACAVGCQRKEAETGGKPSQPAGSDVLARYHFVGTTSLANNTNASKLREFWNLPETRRLAEQTLQRLAHAPRALRGERITPGQDEQGAALLRPMVDDLLRCESFLQVRGPADRTAEWTLTVQLPGDRLATWRTNLAALMALWSVGAPATNLTEGYAGWEIKRAEAPSLVRCVEAGPWLVLGIGPNNLTTVSEAVRRVKGGGRPISVTSNYWLQTELNLPRLAGALGLPPGNKWPYVNLTMAGAGENIRSTARLDFPEPVTGPLASWHVPVNVINEPLTNFTAARGVAPLLKDWRLLQEFGVNQAPDEFYLWAQSPHDFQTFLAFPCNDPAGTLQHIAPKAAERLRPAWQSNGVASINWEPTNHQVLWRGVPYIAPHLKMTRYNGLDYIYGGLFLPAPWTNPPPAELLSQLTSRSNLIYYDWEITGGRLKNWRILAQLFAMMYGQAQFTTNTAAMPWMIAMETKLGNAATEIVADSPTQWSLVRKSPIGFTGFELVAGLRWLESVNFPRLGIELPAQRPALSAAKASAKATGAPAAPPKKPPGP